MNTEINFGNSFVNISKELNCFLSTTLAALQAGCSEGGSQSPTHAMQGLGHTTVFLTIQVVSGSGNVFNNGQMGSVETSQNSFANEPYIFSHSDVKFIFITVLLVIISLILFAILIRGRRGFGK